MVADAARIVPPDEPPFSQWNGLILVGEAPGRQEAERGRVFVGRAGKLLNQQLRQSKLHRRHCVVVNPFNQRPPNNQVKYFFSRPYQVKAEFHASLRRFRRVLVQRQPAIIVALGATAAWALTNYRGPIGARVGKLQPCEYGLVVFAWHPAYLLRTPAACPQQVKILRLAGKLAARLVRS